MPLCKQSTESNVTLYVRVWIETICASYRYGIIQVTLYVRVWIETIEIPC